MSFDEHEGKSELEQRVMEEVESLLAYTGDEEHVEPLDDLAERRWIDTMLDEVETAPFEDERDAGSGSRFRRFAIAAGGLAAAAAVAIGLYFALSSPEVAPIGERPTDPALLGTGTILLSSGELTTPEARSAVGRELEPGSTVDASGGRMVIALPTGITLMLERGGQLAIERLDDRAAEVRLDRGELLASVSPGRRGPEFAVTTGRGRIVVTGTVFSVSSNAEWVAVEVIRGAVQLEEARDGRRTIEASRRALLGEAGDTAIDAADHRAAKDKARLLDMLSADDGATIEIRSVPSGAEVALDGTILGKTPLGAAVRPGHRDLDLALADHGAVRERLDLSPGAAVDRVFEMRPLEDLAVRDSEPLTAAPAKAKSASAVPSHLSSKELLRLAQSLRAAKDWRGAAQTYQALAKRYPGTAEARTALVSLGGIQLDHLGRPARALSNFEAYLRGGGGALTPEALYGKARSLRRLGREAAETAALRELLVRYPGAIQAPQARKRLEKLSADETP